MAEKKKNERAKEAPKAKRPAAPRPAARRPAERKPSAAKATPSARAQVRKAQPAPRQSPPTEERAPREKAPPAEVPAARSGHAPLFGADGQHRGDHALPPALFGAAVSGAVVHQAVTAALANARLGTASTRNRSRVSGGGAKPWRQKGTGRARQGSIRAPHWRHGAVVFGPNGRVYAQRLPKKMRRLALAAALSASAREGRIVVLEEVRLPDARARAAETLLARMGLVKDVVIVAALEPATSRAFGNLSSVALRTPTSLRVADVLTADHLVFAKDALADLASRGPHPKDGANGTGEGVAS
jgi:large subunit ribosomal protein L4